MDVLIRSKLITRGPDYSINSDGAQQRQHLEAIPSPSAIKPRTDHTHQMTGQTSNIIQCVHSTPFNFYQPNNQTTFQLQLGTISISPINSPYSSNLRKVTQPPFITAFLLSPSLPLRPGKPNPGVPQHLYTPPNSSLFSNSHIREPRLTRPFNKKSSKQPLQYHYQPIRPIRTSSLLQLANYQFESETHTIPCLNISPNLTSLRRIPPVNHDLLLHPNIPGQYLHTLQSPPSPKAQQLPIHTKHPQH